MTAPRIDPSLFLRLLAKPDALQVQTTLAQLLPQKEADAFSVLAPGLVVHPEGSGFEAALDFVLEQELPPRHGDRRANAVRIATRLDASIGIDPPALKEFERRHPGLLRSVEQILDVAEPAIGRGVRRNRVISIFADIWNTSGAGKLPPALALVHFDAAVNHGPRTAALLLAQSGGSSERYVDLRESLYRTLMTGPTANLPRGASREIPAHQQGWLKRRIPALRATIQNLKNDHR